MAKESEKVTRIDVRIPNEIYEKIEIIAKETNQPLHHRSGKPIVTPIILNLINLGLEEVAKGEFDLEVLTNKVSANNRIDIKQIEDRILEAVWDKLNSNKLDIEEIEKKLLTSLETKLEAMIETKINDLRSDKISELDSDSNDNFNQSIKEVLSLEDFEDTQEDLEVTPTKAESMDKSITSPEDKENYQLSLIEDTDNVNGQLSLTDISTNSETSIHQQVQSLDETNENDLPSENELQEPIISEGRITHEDKNKPLKDDSKRAKLTEERPLPIILTFEHTKEKIRELYQVMPDKWGAISKQLNQGRYPNEKGQDAQDGRNSFYWTAMLVEEVYTQIIQ